MPWGWECRAKLVKQLPAKPTIRKAKVTQEVPTPSPADYDTPEIFCGRGFSKIKRSPAYTFGHLTPVSLRTPAAKPTAPTLNIEGLFRNGRHKLKHGVISPQIEPLCDKVKVPGPATYAPVVKATYKSTPAYTMRPAAPPQYEAWDMWTPPPNMYCPPIPGKKAPTYSLGSVTASSKLQKIPGPGEHDPNFNFVKNKKPSYSFGEPFKSLRGSETPAPNSYCENKFMVSKRRTPEPTFGIRHSQYLGEQGVYLKPDKLNYALSAK